MKKQTTTTIYYRNGKGLKFAIRYKKKSFRVYQYEMFICDEVDGVNERLEKNEMTTIFPKHRMARLLAKLAENKYYNPWGGRFWEGV